MNRLRAVASAALLVGFAAFAPDAPAATCNVAACQTQIQGAAGVVVNDIFKDANGHDAFHLPVYGKLFNVWQGCPQEVPAACAGTSTPPYNCPGAYSCASPPPTFANASQFLNTLDHTWWQPCRLADPTLVPVGNQMCPQWTCITDGVGGNYLPSQGLVFDLGGPSNKVAIFAQNDHGPQPCESLEYTVFLSNDPHATGIVLHPATDGVDPSKWNRAVLSKIYTWGFETTRAPDPVNFGATCGDTAQFAVEDDSFVQVFSLPCGITFRYASIVAGNDGLDFPACAYDSSEAELDAVAGLTENGAGVCPDADGDGYVDCNCPGAPPVCDCNDSDPKVHPGAPEACDSPDVNCDGKLSPCAAGLSCYQSICVESCNSAEFPCPPGSSCMSTPQGQLCVPADCSVGGCPPGGVCKNNICVPACTGVVCPGTQECQDGVCKDLCANKACPAGQVCQHGTCEFKCSCFAGNLGCMNQPGTNCDTTNGGVCVPPACVGSMCVAPSTCDPQTGQCVPFCNSKVVCPTGEKCADPGGCVPNCQGVTCQTGFQCDPKTGNCVDKCQNVNCLLPDVCKDGMCVPGGTGGAGGQGGGSSTQSTASAGGQGGGTGHVTKGNGCGCRTAGEDSEGASLPLGIAAVGAFFALRRARRRVRR